MTVAQWNGPFAVSRRPGGSLDFGALLREWRRVRCLTQMDLATRAGISPRHLSFMENGRVRPGRAVVQRVVAALALPDHERDVALLASGHAPVGAGSEAVEGDGTAALSLLLMGHEPYPAVATRFGQALQMNACAAALIRVLLGDRSPAAFGAGINLYVLLLDSKWLRPAVCNWEGLARTLLLRLRRDAALDGGALGREVLDRVQAIPGIASILRALTPEMAAPPVLSLELAARGLRLSMLATISTLGTAQDRSLRGVHVEHVFPVDSTSRAFLLEVASTRNDG